jgi:DNA-binding response OmpR family regulator
LGDNGQVRILVVEDDDGIALPIVESLRQLGWSALHVSSGTSAVQEATKGGLDCIVLDLGLPDIDGDEVVRQIRSFSQVPIVVASARPDESDRILSLELGADDYLVKPFGVRELIARIRAVHRRNSPEAATAGLDDQRQIGSLCLSSKTRVVTVDGAAIQLTPREFDVLEYLAQEPGTVYRREAMLSDIWDINWYGSTKTLDAHVASLRKKLGSHNWIESVRGVGFRLVSDE